MESTTLTSSILSCLVHVLIMQQTLGVSFESYMYQMTLDMLVLMEEMVAYE